MSAVDPSRVQAELARLAQDLHETQRQIQELAGGEIDAVIDPSGKSYLLLHAQERLRQEEELQRHFATERAAILDALPAHIALLDAEGTIVAVNEAWRRFGVANALLNSDFGVGQNYVAVCESAVGECSDDARISAQGIREVLSDERPNFALEYPCHSPEEQRWFRLMVTPLDEMRRAGAVVMHVNITERRLADEALRESERRYRILFERNPQPMWVYDVETLRFLEVNDAAIAHYGYTRDEFLAMNVAEIRPPEDIPRLLERISTAVDELHDAGIWRHRLKDGRIISAQVSTHTLDFAGRRAKMVLALDVTQRLEAEAALAASQRQTSLILNAVGEGIHGLDAEGRILFENPAAMAMFGWEKNEMLGQQAHSLVHHHHADGREYPLENCPVYRTLRDGLTRRIDDEVFFRKDGTSFFVEYVCSAWLTESGTIGGVVVNFRDITQRKAQEKALRERQTLLANAQRIGNMGSWSIDLLTGQLYWPPETCELFGVGDIGPNGTLENLRAMILPEDQAPFDEAILNADAAPDGGILEVEYRIQRPDGAIRWMYDRGNVECDNRRRPIRRIGMVMDITARKDAEIALRASEERVQRAFHDAATGIAITTPDGCFVQANAAFCRMVGYPEQELSQLDFASLTHPDDRARNLVLVEELLRGERDSFVIVKRYQTKWGTSVWVRMSVTAQRDSAGNPLAIVGISEDITQQRAAEEELRKSQSMIRMASKLSRMGGWTVEVPSMTMTWSEEAREIHEVSSDYQPNLDEGLNLFTPEYRDSFMETFGRCMREGTPYDLELEKYTANGRRIWIRTIGEAVRDRDGKIIRVQGAIQDVTDRKLAEEALRQKEFLLRIAGKVAQVGGWAVEKATGQVYWSDELCDILDFPRGEVPALNEAIDMYAPTSVEVIREALQSCLDEGTPFDLELEIRTRSGRALWVRSRGEAEYGDDGQVRRAHGAFQDITRHKEAQLRESRLASRLSSTLESITDAFFTLDSEWRFTYMNQMGERLVRRTRDSLLGKVFWEEFPETVDSTFEIEYRRAVGEARPVEFEEHSPSLNMWFGVRAFPTPEGLAVYFNDITDSREARRALQISEERFSMLSKATNDAIWDWDLKTGALWWNEGFEVLFGYHPDEIKPDIDFWTSLIHPDDREGIVADIEGEIAGGGYQWSDEYRFMRSDGTYAFVMDRGYIIRDENGVGVRMIGGMTDITSRKEAETRLVEQAALLDLASDGIIVRSLNHRVVFWNRGAEAIYGWRSDEVMNRPVVEFLYKDTDQFIKAREAVLRDGEWTGELNQCTKTGGMVTVLGRWTLVRDPSGEPQAILSLNADITERKRLENQFLRAQRMESIGTLAGGIAHDLNNVLAPILMSVEILKDKVSDENGIELLESVGRSAQRGADLIKQVLSFARGVEGKRIALNPAHIVHEVQKIVYDTFPRSIYCEVSSPRDLWVVEADPTQLHQVLMNLCVNARDAMPDGGRIEIVLENRVVDEVYSGMNIEARPGPYVMIRVRDTGTGIPKEIQDKIFEPFFTTKEIGKGTGLGLSTTFTIIRDHGGFINLYSEPGSGTKFKVYLPALVGADEAERAIVGQTNLPQGKGELILLVDDEESIRTIATKVLQRYGYRVLVAVNGAEGVSVYVRNQTEIAVVITDMSMPIMDGPAMIVALKSINPDVRIIGSSGLSMNDSIAKALGAGVEHFVPKPYTAETLLQTINQVLEPLPGAAQALALPRSRHTILLAHRDPKQRAFCKSILDILGYPILIAGSHEDAMRLLYERESELGLVLVEAEMALLGFASLAATSYVHIRLMVIASEIHSTQDLQKILGPRIPVVPIPIRANALQEKIRALLEP